MKKIIAIFLMFFLVLPLFAQQNNSQDDEYTKVITARADKIVNAMEFANDSLKTQVRDIIIKHYRFLNNADESRNADVAKIRKELAENKELRDAKIDLRKAEQDIKTRDYHFAFYAQLKQIISEEQIDEVKDGLTYGVLDVTYTSLCDMIPSLTNEEKKQIMIWLVEAREHAIDGGSSKEKHGWFGKYKGKINNYLSARGYNLTEERNAWELRLKKRGVKL